MIAMSDLALDIVQRTHILHTRVQALYGNEVAAADVPVVSGSLEIDRSLSVPERATLTVPRVVDDVSWDPAGSAAHPLAPFGQTLVIELGVELQAGNVEWIQRAELLIAETTVDEDSVEVSCVGLLALIEEARLTTPYQASGTFQSSIRKLVEPALTVSFDAGLPANRAVPAASLTEDEDRLGALEAHLDAWPAEGWVDHTGVFRVAPVADPVTPVLALTDGEGGTVVSWAGSASRDGAYSLVVARGQKPDGSTPQGVAKDEDPASPTRYGGPFNPLPVPLFYASPLLETTAQCTAAAVSILARRKRSTSRMVEAQCVPHPGLEVGDRVTIGNVTGATAGIVEKLTLPLTATGGAMGLTLRVVA